MRMGTAHTSRPKQGKQIQFQNELQHKNHIAMETVMIGKLDDLDDIISNICEHEDIYGQLIQKLNVL